jgi:hypothetical protein
MYLWRVLDSEGEILDVVVQPRRDAAALKLMRKLLTGQLLRKTLRAIGQVPVTVPRGGHHHPGGLVRLTDG